MRATAAIAIYAVSVFVLSALAAPWVFALVHSHFPNAPFHGVLSRMLILTAAAGLWPLLRAVGVRSWRELGFPRTQTWWRPVAVGFVLGVGSFVVAAAVLVALHARTFDAELSTGGLVTRILKFVATGVTVALIEETFFRGGLQGALERSCGTIVALLVASAVYSASHFLKLRGGATAPQSVTWSSGFAYLWLVALQFVHEPKVILGFITLLLAGLTLGWAFAKTRALYLSMGLHAGWVTGLKTTSLLTDGGPMLQNRAMWPVLIVVLLIVAWWCRVNERNSSLAQTSR